MLSFWAFPFFLSQSPVPAPLRSYKQAEFPAAGKAPVGCRSQGWGEPDTFSTFSPAQPALSQALGVPGLRQNPATPNLQSQNSPEWTCRNVKAGHFWAFPRTVFLWEGMSWFGTEGTRWPRKAALGRVWGEPRAEWKGLTEPLWLGGISCSSQEPPGPALGDVENGFHSGLDGAMALKQLQEGAQLARPLPLPAELLWRKAPSPEGVRGSHLLWFQGPWDGTAKLNPWFWVHQLAFIKIKPHCHLFQWLPNLDKHQDHPGCLLEIKRLIKIMSLGTHSRPIKSEALQGRLRQELVWISLIRLLLKKTYCTIVVLWNYKW